MRGGYLTLDFSDREFKEGDNIGSFVLGYKKGIYKYVTTTDKPIYLILSASVMSALSRYCNINVAIAKKCVYFLQPILDTDINFSGGAGHFVLSRQYNATIDSDFVSSPGLVLNFLDDDRIRIQEI